MKFLLETKIDTRKNNVLLQDINVFHFVLLNHWNAKKRHNYFYFYLFTRNWILRRFHITNIKLTTLDYLARWARLSRHCRESNLRPFFVKLLTPQSFLPCKASSNNLTKRQILSTLNALTNWDPQWLQKS